MIVVTVSHADRDAKLFDSDRDVRIVTGAVGEECRGGPLTPSSPHAHCKERRWLTPMRPIKPFLSSTFNDMRTERQHLRQRVSPQLRSEAQSRCLGLEAALCCCWNWC